MGLIDVVYERRSQAEISLLVRELVDQIHSGDVVAASIVLARSDGAVQTHHFDVCVKKRTTPFLSLVR